VKEKFKQNKRISSVPFLSAENFPFISVKKIPEWIPTFKPKN